MNQLGQRNKIEGLKLTFSLLIASMLNVYPLSPTLALFRPMILMMVLIFWLMFRPQMAGVGLAFIIGLVADFLMDTRIGQQAFSAVLMAFTLRFASGYVKRLTVLSTWLLAAMCLLIFQLTLWLLQYITQNLFVPQFGLSLIVSMLSWPLLLLIPSNHSNSA